VAEKNESGAEPVLAEVVIGQYLHRRGLLSACGRSRVAIRKRCPEYHIWLAGPRFCASGRDI
jgi:hypothetical protein